jgi:hypothetical protein
LGNKIYYNDYYLQNDIQYKQGYYNVVRTPCGSGKTFHCLEFITEPQKFQHRYGKERDVKKCLYVTDTSALRESVVADYEMKTGKPVGGVDNINKNLQVITYAKLAHELKKYKGSEEKYVLNFDYIFLDEIHQLFEYSDRFDGRTRYYTQDEEEARVLYQDVIDLLPVICENTTLICLSATPKPLFEHLEEIEETSYIRDLIPTTKLHQIKCYTTNYTEPVWDIQSTVENLDLGEKDKLFIFARTIKELQAFEEICQKKGYTTTTLWSNTYNISADKGHEVEEYKLMSEEQLDARKHLLLTGEYNTQVLLLNAAYESGINIENAKDSEQSTIFVIVATSNEIQITQARGRIRHNIDMLFHLTNCFHYQTETGRENNEALCQRCDQLVEQCQDEVIKQPQEHLFIGKTGLNKLSLVINVWGQKPKKYGATRYRLTSVKTINDFMLLKDLPYEIVQYRCRYRVDGKRKEYCYYVLESAEDTE